MLYERVGSFSPSSPAELRAAFEAQRAAVGASADQWRSAWCQRHKLLAAGAEELSRTVAALDSALAGLPGGKSGEHLLCGYA